MKITLDHNCLIDLSNETPTGKNVRTIIEDDSTECFVVNVGASEMQQMGILPGRYDLFEDFLSSNGLSDLPRLDPIGIFDVTFFDRCLFAGDRDVALLEQIKLILFGGIQEELDLADPCARRKTLNKLCDALSIWCHIAYKNNVFLTSDKNFMKATKRPRLIEIGAGEICRPEDVLN